MLTLDVKPNRWKFHDHTALTHLAVSISYSVTPNSPQPHFLEHKMQSALLQLMITATEDSPTTSDTPEITSSTNMAIPSNQANMVYRQEGLQ